MFPLQTTNIRIFHVIKLELVETLSVWFPALFTQTKTFHGLQWKLTDSMVFPLYPLGMPDTQPALQFFEGAMNEVLTEGGPES